MTTFLAALRFAVNVETALSDLQRARFRQSGDVSTRFLPALVPIAFLDRLPAEGDLDRIRRTAPLVLKRTPVGTEELQATGQIIHSAYRVTIDGFQHINDAIRSSLDVSTDPDAETRLCPDTGRDPLIRLGWSGLASNDPLPLALPQTRALWLSVFQLSIRNDERWWSEASWDLYYSRRVTNKDTKCR